MSVGTLLIRADASVTIGTGHAMRCLALAQAWQDVGGKAVFAMAESTEAIRTRLIDESCDVIAISSLAGTEEDAAQIIAIARAQKCDWIAVDGYSFRAEYQQLLKAAGHKVLFIDDYGHAQHYSADFVLNQNLSARAACYESREPQTRLLLGSRYCLLRREFDAWRNWKREIPSVCRNVLVLMGGSDPENVTARVIVALRSDGLEGLHATVVIGGSNPNFASLQKLAAYSTKITLQRDVSNIAELMAAADMAISAAGSTCWELCFFGLPALLIDVADNQSALAKELDQQGCAIHIGNETVSVERIADQLKPLIQSEELRKSLSQRSRELIDGYGARRVVSALRGPEGITLRRVRTEDARLLWEWANDPEVRAASFSSASIPWPEHMEWLSEKLDRSPSLFLIAEDVEGRPFGQVRFEVNDGDAEFNFSMAKEKRGLGFAAPLIEAAVSEAFASIDCERVHAFVKPQNPASAKAFERAGFTLVGMKQIREHAALHFLRNRN